MTPEERIKVMDQELVYNQVCEAENGGTFEFSEDAPGGSVYKYTETDAEGIIIEEYYRPQESQKWLTTEEYVKQLAAEALPEPNWDPDTISG